MSLNSSLKSGIKKLRSSQPFNRLATSGTRSVLSLVGFQSEFVIRHLHRIDLVKSHLPNGKTLCLQSKGDDWVSNQVFWRGWQGYEPEMTGLFYALAESATTVLDVGAHAGFYSLLAGLANPQARVFAFEPLPRVFASLERNVKLNKLENIRCFSAAIGATTDTQEFYFPDQEQPISSSLRSDVLIATFPVGAIQHVPVSVVPIDQFVAEQGIDKVDLIKLDTERTEHEVLAGARELLQRDHPDIICEVWPDAGNQDQLEDVLRPLGYRFFHLLPEGPQERPRIEGNEQALNYMFTVAQ